jgi:flavodoxin
MSDRKVLVVYYSKSGNTERAAKDIAARLNGDLEKITDKKERKGFWGFLFGGRDAMRKYKTEIGDSQKNPLNYDVTVIGTPIWAANMTPAVRTYVENNKAGFKNFAIFATSGSTGLGKAQADMETLMGKKTTASILFTARDLRNEKTYGEKLSSFISGLTK